MIVSYVMVDVDGFVYSNCVGESIDVPPADHAQLQANDFVDTCHLWAGRIEFPVGVFGGDLDTVVRMAGPPLVTAKPRP